MWLALLLGISLVAAGCGQGGASGRKATTKSGSETSGSLSGEDVIAATRAEGTATFTIQDHGDPSDPGTDHGISGEVADDLDSDVAFDFSHNRSVVRWRFPVDETIEALGGASDPVDVEVRTVDGTSYVKDGSWLCPGCGLDNPDDALPSDQWIPVEQEPSDVAFELGTTDFSGQLGWLQFVDEAIEPGQTSRLKDGTTVVSYRVEIPVSEVNAVMNDPDDDYASPYQGKSVTISFTADRAGRLHELVVKCHLEDRERTLTATVTEFGSAVNVEVPPADEIYRE